MANTIQTVTGPCRPADLGLTLMHEHLIIGWPGWESDTAAAPFDRREARKLCVDRMHELKALGVATLLDPCPIDLGRDVELAAEVAQASGVRIVCATGLYKEESGAAPYYKFRGAFTDSVNEMAEIFIKEISEGIGSTGIKAGVIKVATGPHQVTAYERNVIIDPHGRLRLTHVSPLLYSDPTVDERAVAQIGRLHLSGYFAWLMWLFVHLVLLVGFRNRLMVMREWVWAFFTRERSARLITDDMDAPASNTRPIEAPHAIHGD